MRILWWIKTNKFSTLLILVLAFFLIKSNTSTPQMNLRQVSYDTVSSKMMAPSVGESGGIMPPFDETVPQPQVTDRMVIQESNLSLLVKDVVDVRNKILEYTKKSGGYMISANTSNPQDAPTGTVDVRVPAGKLQDALDFFHSLSVKVVSENLSGYDVTDQYVDVEKRIGYFEQTITQYQNILKEAREVSDITNLTQQIIYTQQQIDNLKGQQDAMEQKSKMARLTVYLSTDEIALPYAPSETWRPGVIFKQAIRAVVTDLRKLGTGVIWISAYGIFWIPVGIILLVIKKKYGK